MPVAERLAAALERIEKIATNERFPAILEIAADALAEYRDPATGRPFHAEAAGARGKMTAEQRGAGWFVIEDNAPRSGAGRRGWR